RAPDAPADGAFARFLRVLADARRLDLMVEVAALYEELKLEADATLKVTVTSAMALDAAEHDHLRIGRGRGGEREAARPLGDLPGSPCRREGGARIGSCKGERLRHGQISVAN
ncbi:MAG: F0F1 ATP synthase subunit delta, partial [Xanthomonadaceae bacterium]|nr:F0F1 ATP synthase subunit delta [Xanthomonadaceae bacterium]